MIFAVRALRELNQPESKMRGTAEAIASIVIAILAVIATATLVGDIVRLVDDS